MRGVEALNVHMDEAVHICKGYILSKAAEELRARGFSVAPRRIAGETQALAKREYISSLARMGIGAEGEVSRMRSYNAFLRWVEEDPASRERYVKTGWRAWSRLKGEGGRHAG